MLCELSCHPKWHQSSWLSPHGVLLAAGMDLQLDVNLPFAGREWITRGSWILAPMTSENNLSPLIAFHVSTSVTNRVAALAVPSPRQARPASINMHAAATGLKDTMTPPDVCHCAYLCRLKRAGTTTLDWVEQVCKSVHRAMDAMPPDGWRFCPVHMVVQIQATAGWQGVAFCMQRCDRIEPH